MDTLQRWGNFVSKGTVGLFDHVTSNGAPSIQISQNFNLVNFDIFVADFNCALMDDGKLLQGKIYIYTTCCVFYSNFNKYNIISESDSDKTIIKISFLKLSGLEKKTCLQIIPNGLQLTTSDSHKYSFTSFLSRDKAYDTIEYNWQQFKNANHYQNNTN